MMKAKEPGLITPDTLTKPQKQFATRVMVWFLVNLLLLPVIGFFVQVRMFLVARRAPDGAPESGLAAEYARVAVWASCIGGALIVAVCLLIYLLLSDPLKIWPLIIVYFTVMHSTFILWGILNLARALAAKPIAPLGFEI